MSWRIWLRPRIRHRAQMARDAPVSGRADLHQPGPRVSRRARAGNATLVLSSPPSCAGLTWGLTGAPASTCSNKGVDYARQRYKLQRQQIGRAVDPLKLHQFLECLAFCFAGKVVAQTIDELYAQLLTRQRPLLAALGKHDGLAGQNLSARGGYLDLLAWRKGGAVHGLCGGGC